MLTPTCPGWPRALTKNNPPWRHPLPSIRETTLDNTHGRLFQTDMRPGGFSFNLSEFKQEAFLERITADELNWDLVMPYA
jgi:hypothetical protein